MKFINEDLVSSVKFIMGGLCLQPLGIVAFKIIILLANNIWIYM